MSDKLSDKIGWTIIDIIVLGAWFLFAAYLDRTFATEATTIRPWFICVASLVLMELRSIRRAVEPKP